MNSERRRIFAFSGVLKPEPDGPPPGALLDFAISLSAASGPVRRVCLIPTAGRTGHTQVLVDVSVTDIARALDRDAAEFSAQLVAALVAVAHTMGKDLAEPDWWRILDALLLIAAHPATP